MDKNTLNSIPETGDLRFQVGPLGEVHEDALYEEALISKSSLTQAARALIIEALKLRAASRDESIAYLAWKRGLSLEEYRRQIHTERTDKN